MVCWQKWIMGAMIVGSVVGLPYWANASRQKHFRNFRTVEPGVLYRSGQLSLKGFEEIVQQYGIKTVVTLRDAEIEGQTPPDAAEETLCRKLDIRHVRIRPQRWWSVSSDPVPAEAGVRRFFEVMDNPANHPVLIHCFAGIHRTGAHVALYRMDYDRWSNEMAIAELRGCGYRHIDDEWDVLGYLENYRPRWARDPQGEQEARR